jgi:hypothetical protein
MEQADELEGCALKRVVRMRAAELISLLVAAAHSVQCALTEPDAEESTREAAAELLSELHAVRSRLEGLDPLAEDGQGGVPVDVATWSQEELNAAANRLRQGRITERGADHVRLEFGRTIRRLPNPEFVARNRRDPVQSRQWHFDRTAALLRLAQEHGGNECILQSMIARRELGTFRNPHVIVAALESGSLDERLAAAASLAFLWSQDGTAALRRAALGDTAPGVRQVALWGFGFANGDDALELARRQRSEDAAPEVRSFAQEIADIVAENERGWWAV